MSCKYCKHCYYNEVIEDYEERKVYLETSRINMYLSGMDMDETEVYMSEEIYRPGNWMKLCRDIPVSKELYDKWIKKQKGETDE